MILATCSSFRLISQIYTFFLELTLEISRINILIPYRTVFMRSQKEKIDNTITLLLTIIRNKHFNLNIDDMKKHRTNHL